MKLDPESVQQRLTHVREGVTELGAKAREWAAEESAAKGRLTALEARIPLTEAEGRPVDAARWNALLEADRREIAGELAGLDEDVSEGNAREPSPRNWMQSRAFVDARCAVWLVGGAIASVFVLCLAILASWKDATGSGFPRDELVAWRSAYDAREAKRVELRNDTFEKKDPAGFDRPVPAEFDTKLDLAAGELSKALTQPLPSERAVVWMIFLFGALGGSIRWLVSIAQYVGNRRLRRSWIAHYLALPFLGAGLGLVIYLLLRVGILSAPAASGEVLFGVNVLGFYAIAAMTGLFAKDALDKLSEVFGTVFNVAHKDKDALGEEGRAAS